MIRRCFDNQKRKASKNNLKNRLEGIRKCEVGFKTTHNAMYLYWTEKLTSASS